MFVTRHNPLGGHPLRPNSFPLCEDPNTKDFGLKIGYMGKCPKCGHGTGEPILVRLGDAEMIALAFGAPLNQCKKLLLASKPKEPLLIKCLRWLLGKKKLKRAMEQVEQDID